MNNMKIHEFRINNASIEQFLSLYVIICTKNEKQMIYVGQTGNQNQGCANITYRLGKHFGYSGTDNILRNKLVNPEEWDFDVIFVHIYKYNGNNTLVRKIKALESYLIKNLRIKLKDMVLNNRTIAFDEQSFTVDEKGTLEEILNRVYKKISVFS